MKNKKTKIIGIVGPTASGKSALALELAKLYDGEIVSCDSMQIYKRMNIGTAKPTEEEMADVRHHMIDIIDPHESFSCEDYVKLAALAIEDCAARGKLPIVCGGTGLYLDALLRGGNSAPVCDTSKIREALTRRAQAEGIMSLYNELVTVDPESANAIHPNNEKRVIRALEIYLSCGITKSELDRRSKDFVSPYDAEIAYLCYENRDILYRRIEKRVDLMIDQGLIKETQDLLDDGVFLTNKTAAQAIGYKELIPYINGETTLDEAVNNLKTATRRYAKRQITWFSAKEYVTPVCAEENGRLKTFEEIVNNTKNLFSL